MLRAIAVIRTFLNYCLERNLDSAEASGNSDGQRERANVDDVLTRFVTDLIARISGPLSFRLILQPMMAVFFAVRDGLREEREHRPPYFTSLFSVGHAQRRELFQEAWKAIFKVFSLAFVLDVVYQLIVLRWVYPFESLAVAIILAILPYVLLRGVVNRIARTWDHSKGHAR